MLLAGSAVLVAALVCLGYGVLAVRSLQSRHPAFVAATTVGDVALIGYMSVATFATVANFFLPLSSFMTTAICLGGLLALPIGYRLLAVRTGPLRGALPLVALLAVLCFYFGSFIPGSTAAHYDTGLYHVQAIRQIMEYPMLLGTANIHMRFGYNSSLFPAAAALSGAGFGYPGLVTSNALLMSFISLAIVQRSLAWSSRDGSRAAIFGILMIGITAFTPILSFRDWAGTPNTDFPSSLAILYAFYLSLLMSDRQQGQIPGPGTGPEAVLLMAVLAFAISLKLTAIPVVLLVAIPMLTWRGNQLRRRELMGGLACAAAIGLPWLARGIGTSGCLAYPLPSSCLPVPWRVTLGVVQSDLNWMRAWSRKPATLPQTVLSDWAWFPEWLAGLAREPALPAFVGLSLLLALCLSARLLLLTAGAPRGSRNPGRIVDRAALFAIAIIGLAFWFLIAPLLRYGASWTVLPLALLIAFFFPLSVRYDGKLHHLTPPVLCASLLVALSLLAVGDVTRRAINRPATGDPFEIPQAEVQSRGVHAGIPVFVPAAGYQCWDAPRICTPHLRDGVRFSPFLWTWVISPY